MRKMSQRGAGFTLIELLVVITIIAILSAIILNTAGSIQKNAARKRAQAEIQALSNALEQYKIDYGDYPTNSSAGTAGANILFRALCPSGSNSYNPDNKVYFSVSKNMLFSSNFSDQNNYFVDPFGQAYQYRYPGATNKSGTNFFDLWSYAGATGTKTNEAQATNHVFWEKNW